MSNDYTFWRDALAGKNPKMFVDDPQAGFYRKAIKERNEAGNNKRVGWSAVAVFMHDGIMTARITAGSYVHDVIGDGLNELWSYGDGLNELWSYIAGNPISEEEYRRVAEEGLDWSDSKAVPAVNRTVDKADNEAPQEPLDVQHATAIKAAIGAAPAAVKSNAAADVALGSKNRIAELRLAADKAGKAIYEPMYRIYTAEQKKWSPMIALATAKEKELNTAILTFRESERRRIAAEQAEAERKQRDIDEANQRAADRAISKGEPEQPPEVVEVAMPAPMAKIAPTYGTRNVREEVKFLLDKVTSWDMLFAHYKNNSDVQALLMKLAGADIKAGRAVPGTTSREGLI